MNYVEPESSTGCSIPNCERPVYLDGAHVAPVCYYHSLDVLEFFLAQIFQRRARLGVA